MKKIETLKPHPKHKEIYSTPKNIRVEWGDLFHSLKEDGLLEPLKITSGNVIVSGVRRWLIAKELGWEQIKTEVIEAEERKINELLIVYNNQRKKNYGEEINEALHLLDCIGNRQGKRNLSVEESGSKFEIVSNIMGRGFGKDTLYKLNKIRKYDKKKEKGKLNYIELIKSGVSINSVFQIIDSGKKNTDIAEIIKSEGKYTLINTSCLKGFKSLDDNVIQMCFTSPPYFKLRLYNGLTSIKNNLNYGEEDSVKEYINNQKEVGKEIYRVLKQEGSFFLNIGDTIEDGINLQVPELLCVAMSEIGFKMVNRIVWVKSNPKPQKLNNGFQPQYEYIYHFVKDVSKYKRRELKWEDPKAKIWSTRGIGDREINGKKLKKKPILETKLKQFKNFFDENCEYASIIKSAVASSYELNKLDSEFDHPAIFSPILPLIPLLQTTEVGDKVLDCFSGSASLGVVARIFGREYLGFEINKQYHKIANKRLLENEKTISLSDFIEIEKMAA